MFFKSSSSPRRPREEKSRITTKSTKPKNTSSTSIKLGDDAEKEENNATTDEENPPDAITRTPVPTETTALLFSPSEDDESISSSRSEMSFRMGLQSLYALPGMTIRAHCMDVQNGFSPCTTEQALTGAVKTRGKKAYWIDVDADERDSDELRSWLMGIQLPPFLVDALSERPESWASQVLPLRKAVLVVLRILPLSLQSDEVAHLAALVMPNLLLTFTSCPRSETGGFYPLFVDEMKVPQRLPAATSSGALLAWLRFHMERTSLFTRELRSSVLLMDEAMDRDIVNVELDEIISAKDMLLKLLGVAEEQAECLDALSGYADAHITASGVVDLSSSSSARIGLDFSRVKTSLAILTSKAGATERMALRVEKHLGDLRERHEGHGQEIMNRRLSILTILSAIFLPLTLVTGIWGMNFQYMPELQSHDAYPLALCSMLLTAATMTFYFWRTGWFH
uniref:Magnesium transporter n=1 Tax=Attheya septentrionalis TaxID=420275 RepID=A0A7S2UAF8_9STRA|mmetsp:Transcript_15393/g.27952  ORF Transcript_15393/g.27952 Transcript_15393/m.27952 type:complete len:453 (+) Transcript_15393:204-1562(+)